jgi:hypothetical protein
VMLRWGMVLEMEFVSRGLRQGKGPADDGQRGWH